MPNVAEGEGRGFLSSEEGKQVKDLLAGTRCCMGLLNPEL